jgi:large subunit ribosomal protein L13e
LRPAVRGQTNRYNGKIKLGRGFTLRELREAGIKGVEYARSLGIAVDLRRKDTSNETLKLNSGRVKDYISRMILYPRSKGQYEKKPVVAEAKEEVLAGPDAKVQNTLKHVLPLPKPEVGYSWANITKEMKEANAFKIQRTELKTTKGFYKRLEEAKKKATSGKK